MEAVLPRAQGTMRARLGAHLGAHLGAAAQIARRWKGRIFFAFADQGLVSAANFLLTILYAWWLPLDDFGRYVVVWTVALFVEAIQVSLIVDSLPAIVSRYGRRNTRIDAAAFWVVAAYSLATSLLLAGAGLIVSGPYPALAGPLFVLAIVNPLQRFYLFLRRLCYIRDRQAVAAAAALAYALASVAGFGVLAFMDAISVDAALALIGVGATAACVTAIAAGVGRRMTLQPVTVVWLASRIWDTGRWLTPAAVVSWIINWGIFPLAAALSGASAAGIIRALQNLLTPILQFNAALHLAILPRIADRVADHGVPYARRFALRATAAFAGTVLIYCAIILATAPFILPLLYGKPEITASASLLWPLALAMLCEASRAASSMSLLAMRRTRIVFVARLISLAVFAAAAFALAPGMGMGFPGILWANALGTAAGAVIVMTAAMRAK